MLCSSPMPCSVCCINCSMSSWNGISFAFRCTIGFSLQGFGRFGTTYTGKTHRNRMFTFPVLSLLSCSCNIFLMFSFRRNGGLRSGYTKSATYSFYVQLSSHKIVCVLFYSVTAYRVYGTSHLKYSDRGHWSPPQQRLSLPIRHYKLCFTNTVTRFYFCAKQPITLAYKFFLQPHKGFPGILAFPAPSQRKVGGWGVWQRSPTFQLPIPF